jgi:hypothetical protein
MESGKVIRLPRNDTSDGLKRAAVEEVVSGSESAMRIGRIDCPVTGVPSGGRLAPVWRENTRFETGILDQVLRGRIRSNNNRSGKEGR